MSSIFLLAVFAALAVLTGLFYLGSHRRLGVAFMTTGFLIALVAGAIGRNIGILK